MSVSIVLAIIVGVLVSSGVVLLLERSLTRVLLGAALLSNGINVMILAMGGRAGRAPILNGGSVADMSDPLPQVMVLTSIVITFAMTAFLLALAYRSWQLQGNDEVQDDIEDRLVAGRRVAADSEDAGADAEADAEEEALAAARETTSVATVPASAPGSDAASPDDVAIGRDPD